MINKNKGIVFWITGLSGSGKSTIAKKILKEIIKLYGPTILFHGDDLRNIFKIKSYDRSSRLKIGKQYTKFCQYITKQNINIIFTVVGLFHELHKYNRKQLKNYIEILIDANFKKTELRKQKFFYKKKTNNVWGRDIEPEYPKNPHVILKNDFKKNKNFLSTVLIKKINNLKFKLI
jgi:adenylylsulfate kinase-like enzyme